VIKLDMGAVCCCCCPKNPRNAYTPIGPGDDGRRLVQPPDGVQVSTLKSYPQQPSSSSQSAYQEPQSQQQQPFQNGTLASSRTNGKEPYLSPRSNIDLTQPAFAGIVVDQKYSTYGYYDKKFIWLSDDCKSLHMSQFTNKTNHHKEANLENVVSIESLPPVKYKIPPPDMQHEYEYEKKFSMEDDIYLNIKFGKGGAIDLRFQDSTEKNEFMKYLQIATNTAKHAN
jgi:hypothetical protein